MNFLSAPVQWSSARTRFYERYPPKTDPARRRPARRRAGARSPGTRPRSRPCPPPTTTPRRPQTRARWLMLGGALLAGAAAGSFVAFGLDNLIIPIVLLLAVVTPILLWRYPRLSLYSVLAAACLFELGLVASPDGSPFRDALTDRVPFFWNVNTIFQVYAHSNFKGCPAQPIRDLHPRRRRLLHPPGGLHPEHQPAGRAAAAAHRRLRGLRRPGPGPTASGPAATSRSRCKRFGRSSTSPWLI